MEGQNNRRRFLKHFFSLLAFGSASLLSFKKNKGLKMGKPGSIGMSSSGAQTIDNSVSGMKKITIEEYFTTESLLDYLRSRIKAGAKYKCLFDYNSEQLLSGGIIPGQRLKDMDEAGIDMQVISALPWHEGLVNPSEGTAMARMTNDEIYRITEQNPKRYAGFAALACQDPKAAANEFERAVKELGLKGAMIYSHIQGEYLDAQKFWPVFEKAEELDVPIYIHPKGMPSSGLEPYLDYGLWGASWGFAADTGLHAMRLISSGLFDKYPDLKIILGHGGEGLPYWLHRIGMGDARPQGGAPAPAPDGAQPQGGASAPVLAGTKIPRALCKKRPGEYVKTNFYVTTSGMFWEPVLMFIHSVLGPDRILFAVDYPAGSNIAGVRSIESLPLSNEDKGKIFHLNTEKLLRM
ncbi:amidohydrolase family protein [Deltaproteobacteria bacterium]|nr:amidohydrolase family protein [Deltaproteobacteria bacterium]